MRHPLPLAFPETPALLEAKAATTEGEVRRPHGGACQQGHGGDGPDMVECAADRRAARDG